MTDTIEGSADWRVFRHSGQPGDGWQLVGAYPDVDQARFEFDLEASILPPAGSVRLFRPDGTLALLRRATTKGGRS